VIGYARMIQLVMPGMRRAGHGRIVNLSSVAGQVTMPGAGWYSASKFAVEALTDALRFEVAGFGVQAVLVEPGPIASGFTGTANEAMASADSSPDGVYAGYHEAIAKADAETDSSFLAGKPEQVARAIERALTARRPRPRYRVTPVARILPALRGTLPDRAWDAFLRTQAPAPGPGSGPAPGPKS
jgi:NAD(P)-dependent dehydrogenase (short-subunit alcohol dehydrogenase family)